MLWLQGSLGDIERDYLLVMMTSCLMVDLIGQIHSFLYLLVLTNLPRSNGIFYMQYLSNMG